MNNDKKGKKEGNFDSLPLLVVFIIDNPDFFILDLRDQIKFFSVS